MPRTAQDAWSDFEKRTASVRDRNRQRIRDARIQYGRAVILVAIAGTCLLLGTAGIFVWAVDRVATALTTQCTCQE